MKKQPENTKILVRLMKEEDLPQAIDIEQRCIADPWSEHVYREEFSHQGEYVWLFVAALADRVIGTISLTRMGSDGEIGNVAVLPEYRRQGIAEEMVRHVMDYGVSDLAMRNFTLEVRTGNLPALKLYEKCGFRTEGIRPKMYRNPEEDACILWRRWS